MSIEQLQRDMQESLDQINNAFTELKTVSDKKDKEFSAKNEARAKELDAQLEKINNTISALEDKMNNAEEELAAGKRLNVSANTDQEKEELASAFLNYFKNPKSISNLQRYQEAAAKVVNTASTLTGTDGGLAVPEEIDSVVGQMVFNSGAFAEMCETLATSSNHHKLFETEEAEVEETKQLEVLETTDTGKLVKITPSYGRMYAKPLISQEAVQDMTIVDVVEWVKNSVFKKQGRILEQRLLTGSGTDSQCLGALNMPMSYDEDEDRALGVFEKLKTGADGAFIPMAADGQTGPADILIDMQTNLKDYFEANASWLMSKKVKGMIRKFKDKNGQWLYQESTRAGEPGMLLGAPVRRSFAMPKVAKGSISLGYGDFSEAFRVCKVGKTLMEILTQTRWPNLEYAFWMRYGLMFKDTEAVKWLEFKK